MTDHGPESEIRETDTLAPPTEEIIAPTANKMIDENTYFNMKDPMARVFVGNAKNKEDERRSRLAKPNSLGLPPLLEKRRLEYLIPDESFREQPLFDRIFVHQISMWGDRDTYGDSQIVMTQVTKESEKFSNPRGILVAAGLLALDEIRSSGVDLGHVVTFIKLAPWRLQVASHSGVDEHLLVLRSCDLIASEDLMSAIRSGHIEVKLDVVEKDGRKYTTHIYLDKRTGKEWHPLMPSMPEEM